ncbi:AAA family ATPase [Pseudomonas sp.]|uniref:AAA family ATPase n=1 Tax=Pseudomonas sp. TaxID=306 RepID=UPI0028AF237F|nr:AAA family ATPase [Pseudomonas sp.]
MTSLSADDSYLNHYGFSHDPFAARVPGFKFFPAQRKPVLGQLHHLARYSQLLLVVTGPEGSGKTLVRQALVASSNKQSVQSVVISPHDTLDSSALLQQVAQALGCARSDFDSIMAQIIQLALTGQEVYLLVDDAERLTGAAVETLLRLAQGCPEGRPHVFLFGEQALVARLEALVEGEERFHVIALQPYELDETREYLTLRLEGAGGRPGCLNDEQVLQIHEESGGWPGAINQAARDELLAAMQQSKGKGKAGAWRFSLPIKHLLALVAVIVVIVVALLMRGREDEPVTPVATPLPLDGAPPSASAGADASAPGPTEEAEEPIIREPLAAAGGAEPDDPAAASGLADSRAAFTPEVAQGGAPVEAPAIPQLAAPAPAPVQQPAAVERAAAPARPATPPAPAPRVEEAAPADWYASQRKTHYLVQVLGTRSQGNAQALIKTHGEGFRYFVKQHEGKPLYVVTYGNFASRDAAVAAIKALPQALRAGKPWPRSFASVQQEMKGAR